MNFLIEFKTTNSTENIENYFANKLFKNRDLEKCSKIEDIIKIKR